MPSLKILTFFSCYTVYSFIPPLNVFLADLAARLGHNSVYVYIVNTHNEILVRSEMVSKILCFL